MMRKFDNRKSSNGDSTVFSYARLLRIYYDSMMSKVDNRKSHSRLPPLRPGFDPRDGLKWESW